MNIFKTQYNLMPCALVLGCTVMLSTLPAAAQRSENSDISRPGTPPTQLPFSPIVTVMVDPTIVSGNQPGATFTPGQSIALYQNIIVTARQKQEASNQQVRAFFGQGAGQGSLTPAQLQALLQAMDNSARAQARVESAIAKLSDAKGVATQEVLNENLVACNELRNSVVKLTQQLRTLPRTGPAELTTLKLNQVDNLAVLVQFLEGVAPALNAARKQMAL